ncbi:MAG: amidohydrolase family protein [Hyphomicrobiales bacterium]|nr:amidohydrolase family protein [Hyphomicrobiales bacterium]
MGESRIIDTHAHIIDPVRFPLADGPGYKPLPHETGTSEEYCNVLDAHDVAHALLVQPSGYGYDNSALLDAMARHPGRFKAIAVIDPETPESDFAALARQGVVGVRFNLLSHRADALEGPVAGRFLARLRELDWFAQVFADDAQWQAVGPILRRSGVTVLIDHFGVRNPADGLSQPGFAAVLALGREGKAAVKLSAPFRLSRRPEDFADLDPFAEALIEAFGLGGCVWGSDWPFINFPSGFSYDAALRAITRWLSDPGERSVVMCSNPARLFGFPEPASRTAP